MKARHYLIVLIFAANVLGASLAIRLKWNETITAIFILGLFVTAYGAYFTFHE